MKKTSLIWFSLLLIGKIFAQENNLSQRVDTKITVTTATDFHVTQSLNLLYSQEQIYNMDFETIRVESEQSRRKPQEFKYSVSDGLQYGNDPAAMQTTMGIKQPLPIIKKWNGITSGSKPLDPTGACGMTQYVQAINGTPYAVYDKTGTGTVVYKGSVGTVTGSGSNGDPVVAYDKFADRWVITQLNGNGFAFAVSKTNDPAGAWASYQFPETKFPDYERGENPACRNIQSKTHAGAL